MKKKSIKKNIFKKPIIKKVTKSQVVAKPQAAKFLVSKSLVSKTPVTKVSVNKATVTKPQINKTPVAKPQVNKAPVAKPQVNKAPVSKPIVNKPEPQVVEPIVTETPIWVKTISTGNDSSMRTTMDGYTDFTIIDTNNPILAKGELTVFSYYASNLNPFRFVLVDAGDIVKWVSNIITPSYLGVNNYTPSAPVPVEANWNLGVYFSLSGTIPFENVGTFGHFTPNKSGAPVLEDILTFKGKSPRTYSFRAIGIEK